MSNFDSQPSDSRLSDAIKLLQALPLDKYSSFLDVGLGSGEISKWLVEKGKKVTAIGLAIDTYGPGISELRKLGVSVQECSVEKLDFPDHSFDCVVMSHILEHCLNVGTALSEIKRVLKKDGSLFVLVPPHGDSVCAGHVVVGWNIVQLMYVLLVSGFDVKNGAFAEYGYNVCGFVKVSDYSLPTLRCDQGDILTLSKAGLLPLPIQSKSGTGDAIRSDIKSINWPDPSIFPTVPSLTLKQRLIRACVSVTPMRLRHLLGHKFAMLSGYLLSDTRKPLARLYNPDYFEDPLN